MVWRRRKFYKDLVGMEISLIYILFGPTLGQIHSQVYLIGVGYSSRHLFWMQQAVSHQNSMSVV